VSVPVFFRVVVKLGATRLILLAALGCVLGCDGPANLPSDDELRLDVLFIGNSLTYWNDLPGMLARLFERGGAGPVRFESVTSPGVGLPDHWVDGEAVRRIREGGWDVVVLQQGPSATEGRPYLLEYTQLFDEEITAAGARTALYMVWPAEARFHDFDGVSDSYATAAGLVGGLLFPAGEAWLEAWDRDPRLELYGPDRFHPSLRGTYLAALVMYQQLAGRNPRDLPAAIPTDTDWVLLPADEAVTLQDAAASANAAHALP
jgi:hypothetical protein